MSAPPGEVKIFVAEGPDAPRDELPMVERDAITAVVRDPASGEYLGLKWKKVDWDTLITGGIEENQTAEAAARAEVSEETGYDKLNLVSVLPSYEAQFYHHPKGENRHARFQSFLFEISDSKANLLSHEELEKHEPVWLNPEELATFRLPEGHRYLIDYILDHSL